jgi:hypothetical protein
MRIRREGACLVAVVGVLRPIGAHAEAPAAPTSEISVYIQSSSEVSLYDAGEQDDWRPLSERFVCRWPCREPVDRSGGRRFIVANVGGASDPFSIDVSSPAALLKVEPPSPLKFHIAAPFLVLGGLSFAVGAAITAPAWLAEVELDFDEPQNQVAAGTLIGGTGVALVGLLIMAFPAPLRVEVLPDDGKPVTEFAIDRRPKARAPRYWLGEL